MLSSKHHGLEYSRFTNRFLINKEKNRNHRLYGKSRKIYNPYEVVEMQFCNETNNLIRFK